MGRYIPVDNGKVRPHKGVILEAHDYTYYIRFDRKRNVIVSYLSSPETDAESPVLLSYEDNTFRGAIKNVLDDLSCGLEWDKLHSGED